MKYSKYVLNIMSSNFNLKNLLTIKFILFFTSLILMQSCVSFNYKKRDIESRLHKEIKSMIMIGFRDKDLNHILKQNVAGGYILFNRDYLTKSPRNAHNKENLLYIISQLQKHNINMISVDNEGGSVNRFKLLGDFDQMPSLSKLAQLKTDEIYDISKHFACEMKDFGITINFTPVVDLKINKDPEFFLTKYERVASDNPTLVTKVASEIVKAHRNCGVVTSLKHFPGHGSALNNSHLGFTDITNTWKDIELIPYHDMIKNKHVDMIMVAHVFNKNLDAKYPASMSSRIINDLLRTKMKYEGVVITDAIDMYALSHNFTLEEIVINSINAGTDIILHANQMQYDKDIGQKIYNIIIEAVYNGLISEERIHKSYQRINKMTNHNL